MIAVALEELRRHCDKLAAEAKVPVEIDHEGAQVHVILRGLPLPLGAYRVSTTDVLYVTDAQYPLSAMDMFWTDPAVLLMDGSVPTGAELIETYGGREWRRFSWHRNGTWNPNGNPLLDHFEFMQARLAMDAKP